ncbi:PfkB family carbohydrate kinase [Streptomycetaceae bacterium NBC_01309]
MASPTGSAGRGTASTPITPSAPRGLFVGLCVLDIIQSVGRLPGPDEKTTALGQTVAAGGPATNAAAAFAALGGSAVLLTGVGRHPLAEGIRADLAGIGADRLGVGSDPGPAEDLAAGLAAAGVRLLDADANRLLPPSVSSVLITASTGERAVVSTNAAASTLLPPPELADEVAAADVLLVDGHHMQLARAAVEAARDRGRPVVLDGGSWKAGTDALLPYVDIAVCSEAFRPPGVAADHGVLSYLLDHGVRMAAVSRGPRPILWRARAKSAATATGSTPPPSPPRGGEVEVPSPGPIVDTVGAGDVLHGALAYAFATCPPELPWKNADFPAMLRFAATIAGHSCTTPGTRAWMAEASALAARTPSPVRGNAQSG